MHLYLNTKDELQTRSRELMLNAAESGDWKLSTNLIALATAGAQAKIRSLGLTSTRNDWRTEPPGNNP